MKKKQKMNDNFSVNNSSTPDVEKIPLKITDYDAIEEFDADDGKEKIPIDSSVAYSKHLRYEGDVCIYTEPESNKQMIWDVIKNAWIPHDSGTVLPASNDLDFDGENYIYTDKSTNVTYKFDQKKNEWIVEKKKEVPLIDGESFRGPAVANPGGFYGFENDTHTYTDPNDGTAYFWDREKSAWFPKVDDDFMAKYQMSYGFVDSSSKSGEKIEVRTRDNVKLEKEQRKVEAKRKAAEPPSWFEIDEAHNTAIYISGLPLDITLDELEEIVTKYGLLARDDKNKDKIKLYMDADGQPKGDALCTYIKIESVNLALSVLDGFQLRNKTISVQRAKFQMKGQYDPALKPKRKKNYKERQKKIQEKLLDWRPEPLPGGPSKNERVVIIKNLFAPEDFDKDVQLLLEYQQDVRSECVKCGEVKKVTIYDRHPEGVAQVSFREPIEAQACIHLLNGRWFGQRKITAEIWDGKTKYKIVETDAEIEARINKWEKHLENANDEKKDESEAAE